MMCLVGRKVRNDGIDLLFQLPSNTNTDADADVDQMTITMTMA
jgi:hypothetical protein